MRYVITIIMLLMTSVLWAEEKDFSYDDHNKRDPFWSLVSPSGAILNYDKDLLIADMALEGIIVGTDGNNLAIINGTIVKPEDKIGLYLVSQITNQEVILIMDNEEFVLRLKSKD